MPETTGYTQPFENESYFVIVLLIQYCSSDKIEKNEMGGACSAYGGEQESIQYFGGET
jgi:hypothetical protein